MNNNNLVKNWKKFLLEQGPVMTQGIAGDQIVSGQTEDEIRLEKALLAVKKVEDYWSPGKMQARDREAERRAKARAKEAERLKPTEFEKMVVPAIEKFQESVIMLFEWFNPFDFLLNWADGPQDLAEYYEDLKTAMEEKAPLRLISAWQCMLVTGLGMIPLTSKIGKIPKAAKFATKRNPIALQTTLFMMYSEGSVKMLKRSGVSDFVKHGKKLEQILNNTKREIGWDGSGGDFDGGGATDSLEIDPESPNMSKRPRGRNQ